MSKITELPGILVIDDLFGRTLPYGRNEERANLCGQYLLEDVTGDEVGKGTRQKIKSPIAQVVFYRGQVPVSATVGDTVENDLEGTLQVIRNGWENARQRAPRWSMVLLDLCFYTGPVTEQSDRRTQGMPEGHPEDNNPQRYFGLRILEAIHHEFPDLPVIILSSMPREEVSHKYSTLGALGFLPRSDAISSELLQQYIWRHGLTADHTGTIIGHSKDLLLTLRAARRAALRQRNVLIRGERGTGKELVARMIHKQGPRASKPFVAVNCGAIPRDLMESELFGHRKGSFTGALADKPGLFQNANEGTLFLDEVAELPLPMQVKLLRVIQEKVVRPVGASEEVPVDVHVLSATNADIEGLSDSDQFRADLLDRLREGGAIVMPPLRDRKEDIPLLVERFVREAEESFAVAVPRQIDPEAVSKFRSYEWPGNVRELRNCIFGAIEHNPDVEHLVPGHIRFARNAPKESDDARTTRATEETYGTPPAQPATKWLDDVVAALSTVPIETIDPAQIKGKLSIIESAYAGFLVRLLQNALRATRKVTLDDPDGKVQIHPAVKFLSGNPEVTGSQAADFIKKVYRLSRDLAPLWHSDPLLRDAYEKAKGLRPTQPKSQKGSENHSDEICASK